MPNETKGITVKVDAELHAQVKAFIESHGMTMSEFVAQALDNELHPKMQEVQTMGNMRTMAFQVPEELFQQIKDYLKRNNLTQKEFVIGLIKTEIERDLAVRQTVSQTEDIVGGGEISEESYEYENEDCCEESEELDEAEDMAMNMG